MKIKKNDSVKVIAGADRGKTGKVLRVLPEKGKVIVEGVGVTKKHLRQNPQESSGGIVEKERPLNVSNVSLLCQRCGVGIRAGCKVTAEGERSRYCRKCGEML